MDFKLSEHNPKRSCYLLKRDPAGNHINVSHISIDYKSYNNEDPAIF